MIELIIIVLNLKYVIGDLKLNTNHIRESQRSLFSTCDLIDGGTHVLAPKQIDQSNFHVLLYFETFQDLNTYCENDQCNIKIENGEIVTWFSLSNLAYIIELNAFNDGFLILKLEPLNINNDCQGIFIPSPIEATVLIDFTWPKGDYKVIRKPSPLNPSFDVIMSFNEAIQYLNISNFSVSNGAILSLKGNSTMYYIKLFGFNNQNTNLCLYANNYRDISGNYGQMHLNISVPIPNIKDSNINILSSPTSLFQFGLFIIHVLITLMCFIFNIQIIGNNHIFQIMRHTQFIAMCSSLAIPNLPDGFLNTCEGYKWSLLIKRMEHDQINMSNDPFMNFDYYEIPNNEININDPVIQDWLNSQILKYGRFIDFNSLNEIEIDYNNEYLIFENNENIEYGNYDILKNQYLSIQSYFEYIFKFIALFWIICTAHNLLIYNIKWNRIPSILKFPILQVQFAMIISPIIVYISAIILNYLKYKSIIILIIIINIIPISIYLLRFLLIKKNKKIKFSERLVAFEVKKDVSNETKKDSHKNIYQEIKESPAIRLSSQREEETFKNNQIKEIIIQSENNGLNNNDEIKEDWMWIKSIKNFECGYIEKSEIKDNELKRDEVIKISKENSINGFEINEKEIKKALIKNKTQSIKEKSLCCKLFNNKEEEINMNSIDELICCELLNKESKINKEKFFYDKGEMINPMMELKIKIEDWFESVDVFSSNSQVYVREKNILNKKRSRNINDEEIKLEISNNFTRKSENNKHVKNDDIKVILHTSNVNKIKPHREKVNY